MKHRLGHNKFSIGNLNYLYMYSSPFSAFMPNRKNENGSSIFFYLYHIFCQ